MANFNKAKDHITTALESMVAQFDTYRTSAAKSHLFTAETAEMLSVESADLSDAQQRSFSNNMADIRELVASVVSSESAYNGVELQPHQIDAGAIVAGASGNTLRYVQAQMKPRAYEGTAYATGLESIWDGASLDMSEISKESFDEKELNQFINYSIVFNVMASRQDDFNAAFFKPLTTTPDEVGYRVTVRLEQVWNGAEHDPSKAGDTAFNYRNLVDALVHPEVLEDNATDVIPAVLEFENGAKTNKDEFFIIDGELDPVEVKLEDVTVKTAPLKIGRPHNLLKLSSIPELIANGLMNEKDSLDSRIALSAVYFKTADNKAIKFVTKDLPYTQFYKTPEGHFRSMALNYDGRFLLSKAVKTTKGEDLPADLKALQDAGYDVYLRVRVNGSIRVDSANVDLTAPELYVAEVFKDGVSVSLEDATLKPLLAKLKFGEDAPALKVAGYDIEARRTNYNLRTRGRLIDSNEFSEQFVIPLRSPISIIKPIVGGDKANPDIKALINAARIQANNDGVKTILNYAALLKSVVTREGYTYMADRESIPGIGRHFIQPCYIEEDLHLPDLVNSVSSANRLADIQGGISTKVNEILGRVFAITNYQAVVEQMTGGSIGNITAVIGTDQRLPQYFAIQGDERLFQGRVKHKVVATSNKHMRGKVVMTVTRDGASEGPDPFSFGSFLWTPELMVSAQRTLGASTFQQHLIHPRYAHVVNLPIVVVLNITGIEEVTGESTVLPTRTVTADEAATIRNAATAPKNADKDGKAPVMITPTKPEGK
nr:MAG TPA: major capsid protein [Caudoviricetes sp.]